MTKITEEQEVELFGTKEGRWYQVAARNMTFGALQEGHRRICIVQPTGSGKTLTAGLILIDDRIRKFVGVPEGKPIKVLFASHRHRLLSQAEATYAAEELIEIIPQSISSDIPEDVKFDLVVIYEAHHESTISFQNQLERLTQAPIIGLTADLNRNDSRLCKFSKVIEPITRNQAVEEGFLARTFVHTFVDSPTKAHVEVSLEIIKNHHQDMGQTMVFVRTKGEAADLVNQIKELGLTADYLVDVSETKLNELLADFEKSGHQFAVSCMKLGEGVDVKGCQSVLIGRTLKSRNLLNQLIGRASRPDSICCVYEIVNPLASNNLSAVSIVGTPEQHTFHYKVRGEWRNHRLS